MPALRNAASFWTAIVVIRTAGTNLGDLFARHLSLEASTVVTGLALATLLLVWRPQLRSVAAEA